MLQRKPKKSKKQSKITISIQVNQSLRIKKNNTKKKKKTTLKTLRVVIWGKEKSFFHLHGLRNYASFKYI